MWKPSPYDRNIVPASPSSDAPQSVNVKPLAASRRRQHQGAAPRATSRTTTSSAGFSFLPDERETPPEQQLWAAVILQALDDAVWYVSPTTEGEICKAKADAISWFADAGRDFREVCHLAGLDPEVVQERALRRIAAHIPKPFAPRRRRQPATPRRSRLARTLMTATALSPVRAA